MTTTTVQMTTAQLCDLTIALADNYKTGGIRIWWAQWEDHPERRVSMMTALGVSVDDLAVVVDHIKPDDDHEPISGGALPVRQCQSVNYAPGPCSGPADVDVVYRSAHGTHPVIERHPACRVHGDAEVYRHHQSAGIAPCSIEVPAE